MQAVHVIFSLGFHYADIFPNTTESSNNLGEADMYRSKEAACTPIKFTTPIPSDICHYSKAALRITEQRGRKKGRQNCWPISQEHFLLNKNLLKWWKERSFKKCGNCSGRKKTAKKRRRQKRMIREVSCSSRSCDDRTTAIRRDETERDVSSSGDGDLELSEID